MQCGFLAFRDLNGHLCPMLITLESPWLSELGGWRGARTPSDFSRSVILGEGGGADYAPNVTTCPTKFSGLPTALNPHALFLLHALENLESKRTDSCYQTVNSQALVYHAKIPLLILHCLKKTLDLILKVIDKYIQNSLISIISTILDARSLLASH